MLTQSTGLMAGTYCTYIMSAMFDMHKHLKKDVCNITAFLLTGNQTIKYKFSPGAKYRNKKPGKYRKQEIKNVRLDVKNGSVGDGKQDILFMVPNILYCLFCSEYKKI